MARAALNWTVAELTQQSGIAARSIGRFENGEGVRSETVLALAKALVAAGIIFVDMDGKRGVIVAS
jgi:transcriptional regulator with XRE-family HTH domain